MLHIHAANEKVGREVKGYHVTTIGGYGQLLMSTQIHSGSDDHLKCRSSVIGSYPQWQAKELKEIVKWSSLSLCLSVREMSVTCEFGCTSAVAWLILCFVHEYVLGI